MPWVNKGPRPCDKNEGVWFWVAQAFYAYHTKEEHKRYYVWAALNNALGVATGKYEY